jgi:hypothetical protein
MPRTGPATRHSRHSEVSVFQALGVTRPEATPPTGDRAALSGAEHFPRTAKYFDMGQSGALVSP